MSHIVQGKSSVEYRNREILIEALQHHGEVYENECLYIENGFSLSKTSERYEIVLASKINKRHRMGFNAKNGVYQAFQENYGAIGRWTQTVTTSIADLYVAIEYRNNLTEQGYDCKIEEQNGAFVLLAEEECY
ncbi:hypothetical protein NRC85_003756 [Vibrio parahaemolyticus]|nr:hypothetical protein [Vibrio parahaemolyticus]